jgi:hypothetical protein
VTAGVGALFFSVVRSVAMPPDRAQAIRAERDRVRYLAVVEKRAISRSECDARATEATADAQSVDAGPVAIRPAEQTITEARSLGVLANPASASGRKSAGRGIAINRPSLGTDGIAAANPVTQWTWNAQLDFRAALITPPDLQVGS